MARFVLMSIGMMTSVVLVHAGSARCGLRIAPSDRGSVAGQMGGEADDLGAFAHGWRLQLLNAAIAAMPETSADVESEGESLAKASSTGEQQIPTLPLAGEAEPKTSGNGIAVAAPFRALRSFAEVSGDSAACVKVSPSSGVHPKRPTKPMAES